MFELKFWEELIYSTFWFNMPKSLIWRFFKIRNCHFCLTNPNFWKTDFIYQIFLHCEDRNKSPPERIIHKFVLHGCDSSLERPVVPYSHTRSWWSFKLKRLLFPPLRRRSCKRRMQRSRTLCRQGLKSCQQTENLILWSWLWFKSKIWAGNTAPNLAKRNQKGTLVRGLMKSGFCTHLQRRQNELFQQMPYASSAQFLHFAFSTCMETECFHQERNDANKASETLQNPENGCTNLMKFTQRQKQNKKALETKNPLCCEKKELWNIQERNTEKDTVNLGLIKKHLGAFVHLLKCFVMKIHEAQISLLSAKYSQCGERHFTTMENQ